MPAVLPPCMSMSTHLSNRAGIQSQKHNKDLQRHASPFSASFRRNLRQSSQNAEQAGMDTAFHIHVCTIPLPHASSTRHQGSAPTPHPINREANHGHALTPPPTCLPDQVQWQRPNFASNQQGSNSPCQLRSPQACPLDQAPALTQHGAPAPAFAAHWLWAPWQSPAWG
jgi:hypothetical protein